MWAARSKACLKHLLCCAVLRPAALTCARARLQDGQAVLELGCGWGSLTLFMAQAYRNSTITAVSNSNTQREFIMRRARDLDLHNVQVLTADMVDFQVGGGECGGG
jgi:cyclopropane-fatty-acyl-phospholipid synthase